MMFDTFILIMRYREIRLFEPHKLLFEGILSVDDACRSLYA